MKISNSSIFLLLCFVLSASVLLAQDTELEECPVFVEEAIMLTDEYCGNMGRNSVCYGHTLVAITGQENTQLEFEEPGDLAALSDVQSIATFPMNEADETWGIAVMNVQANLEDSLPGQAVTFVLFGDVAIENEIQSGETVEVDAAPPTLTAVANSNANLRLGPSTDYAVAGGLSAGDEISIVGRNAAGDWLQIEFEDQTAWCFAQLLDIESEIETLAIVEGDVSDTNAESVALTEPFQAFRFSSGVGTPQCKGAPGDGMLIQAPTDTIVYFRINGADIQVGSTGLLKLNNNGMGISTLDGLIVVTAGDVSKTAEPGQRIDVVANTAPADPVPYSVSDVSDAPVSLLPEQVNIPPPAGNEISMAACHGAQQTVNAGEPIILRIGWAAQTAEQLADFVDAGTYEMTINGEMVDYFTTTAPFERDGLNIQYWYWVIEEPESGDHYELSVFANLSRPISDGESTINPGDYDALTCLVVVQ